MNKVVIVIIVLLLIVGAVVVGIVVTSKSKYGKRLTGNSCCTNNELKPCNYPKNPCCSLQTCGDPGTLIPPESNPVPGTVPKKGCSCNGYGKCADGHCVSCRHGLDTNTNCKTCMPGTSWDDKTTTCVAPPLPPTISTGSYVQMQFIMEDPTKSIEALNWSSGSINECDEPWIQPCSKKWYTISNNNCWQGQDRFGKGSQGPKEKGARMVKLVVACTNGPQCTSYLVNGTPNNFQLGCVCYKQYVKEWPNYVDNRAGKNGAYTNLLSFGVHLCTDVADCDHRAPGDVPAWVQPNFHTSGSDDKPWNLVPVDSKFSNDTSIYAETLYRLKWASSSDKWVSLSLSLSLSGAIVLDFADGIQNAAYVRFVPVSELTGKDSCCGDASSPCGKG